MIRKINTSMCGIIQAVLSDAYHALNEPITYRMIENDRRLRRFNPRTIERTMRVMAQRGIIKRPSGGAFIPFSHNNINNETTLEDFI